jgi:16S rRNA (guanine966-N2)-methyltransferase
MRIISGIAKGTRILAPAGMVARPTRDAVREAFFGVLGSWIRGRFVLDLYAGSGSLGLEALSRGAAEAVFVEKHPDAVACIQGNLERAGLTGQGRIVREDCLRFLSDAARRARQRGHDAVFADPPFAFSSSPGLIDLVKGIKAPGLWSGGEGLAMIEVEARGARLEDLQELPGEIEFRRYGRNLLCIARHGRGKEPNK